MKKINQYIVYAALAINLGIIFYFWWNGSGLYFSFGLSGALYALGKLFGLSAVYFILLQFVLMGRAVWIEKCFGLDTLARIHRLNGYLSILFILLHPILLITSSAIDNKVNFLQQFIDFFQNYADVPWAVLAVIIFVCIVFSSIYIVRKRLKYETWYFVHLLTYLGVLSAFGHQLKLGSTFQVSQFFTYYWYALYIVVFGNVFLFRFIQPLYNFFTQKFKVHNLIAETYDTTSVYIEGKNIEKLKAEAGQFFILRFLTKKLWWQAHPFSLSYVPKNNQLRFTIKRSGDFTAEIANIPKNTPVMIEGPFGVFTAAPTSREKFLFIAGGVGITPLRALIEKLAPDQDIILLYNNKTSQDIIFKEELDQLAFKHQFPIHYIMSDEASYTGEKGRVDQEKLARLVPDLQERKIFLCGPPPMLLGIKNILIKNLKINPRKLHYELFAL